jgi:hypothetical protein
MGGVNRKLSGIWAGEMLGLVRTVAKSTLVTPKFFFENFARKTDKEKSPKSLKITNPPHVSKCELYPFSYQMKPTMSFWNGERH